MLYIYYICLFICENITTLYIVFHSFIFHNCDFLSLNCLIIAMSDSIITALFFITIIFLIIVILISHNVTSYLTIMTLFLVIVNCYVTIMT